jgi:H+/Cl- antiporter ClcA
MTGSRRAGLTFLVITIFLAVGCVAVGYLLFGTALEGHVFWGRGSSKREIVAAESPFQFLLILLVGLVAWLMFCAYVLLRFKIWLDRDKRPEAFESEVKSLEKTTSKTGNVLAWVLAAPFILIGILVLIGMAMNLGKP